MFKKEPHIKALSNLKNSDRKKLLKRCRDGTDDNDYNFPSTIVKQTNFEGHQQVVGTIYTDDQEIPIWFNERFDDKLFPTVYTCWDYPELLPTILTHDIVIEERIFNGANLMVSGTVPPFDNRLVPGTVCAVANKTQPKAAMAVGVVEIDMTKYDAVYGEKGVAVRILHFYGDCLSKVFKISLTPPAVQLSAARADNEQEESKPQLSEKVSNAIDLDSIADIVDTLTTENIDYFFIRALYYTLTQDTKLELPISASVLMSAHILKNMPIINDDINVKKTSWKKTSKFLKHFEKEGLLKLKGKGDNLVVISFDKEKQVLKSFVPYKVPTSRLPSTPTDSKESTSPGIYASSFYRPLSKAKDFLTMLKEPPMNYMTAVDVRNLINRYIDEKGLTKADKKSMVLLDDVLLNMFSRKKPDASTPRTVSRPQLLEAVLENNFQEFYQLFRGKDEPLTKHPVKGTVPHIKIVTEKMLGRKIVTKVSNFEVFKIDADVLAADLRKICSGATTIGETTQLPKVTEVQVQGPHGNSIIKYMNERGIPSKWIEFQNKVKGKRK